MGGGFDHGCTKHLLFDGGHQSNVENVENRTSSQDYLAGALDFRRMELQQHVSRGEGATIVIQGCGQAM